MFNAEEQAKYREFKEARRGAADYMADGGRVRQATSRTSTRRRRSTREALTDECEILVVGAGFAGLLLWYKLREAGFTDVRFCEKGGDVGGTWYWNRYPGIACDVESYSYLPLLEEMGYFPTMKFASGFEILEYCQKMAEKFGFYDHCLFHTDGRADRWDEDTGRWTVYTDRGDAMRARFVILANGILTTPEAGPHRGHGDASRASRSTPRAGTTTSTCEGKRVGIIGTGATAVQAIPELAKIAGELYVFQRTPSTIDVRDQRATTDEEIETWAQRAGLGDGPARPLRQDLGRPHRACRPTTTTSPARSPTSRSASEHERAAHAGGADPEAARHQLPHHGADPRPGRRHRQGPEDRRGAQAVLPLRLQAADVPRRVPADVQPARTCTWSTPRRWA